MPRHTPEPALVQAKLRIGEPNDQYEQEADDIAEEIMCMPDQELQRQTVEEEEEEEGESAVRTKAGDNTPGTVSVDLADSINAATQTGRPLHENDRSFFESRLGADLSSVRICTDRNSAIAARTLNARAYTTKNAIGFAEGQYRPESADGRRLLGHELVHVIQQGQGGSSTGIQLREEPGAPVAPTGAVLPQPGAQAPGAGRPSPDNRTQHSVTVVDFGENTDVYNWREAIIHIGEIEAESVDQMVADVTAEVGDAATDSISRLTLVGHGSPGNVSVGDGTGWVAEGNISTGNFRPSIAQLTPYFRNDATVVLYACNVGRGPRGARFIQRLADFWQVNVAAPTGGVDGFGIMGVWVWGQPGQVLPNDTGLIVDQIVRILDETTYGDDEEMIFDILCAGENLGLLAAIQAELVRLGRWNELRENLIDEDEDRFNGLYP
jgi:hypothetical protein